MRSEPTDRSRRLALWIAALGIAIELAAIWLLKGGRVAVPVAMPILIVGMFMAFVPAFMILRSKRR